MLERPIPNNEYKKAIEILEELENGDLREGLFNCFAISRRGEVVWFDEVGTPFGVDIQGSAFVKTRVLNLPSQKMQVVSLEEAYQQILKNHEQKYLTVLANVNFQKRGSNGFSVLSFLILICISLAGLFMLTRPYSTTVNSGLESSAAVGEVKLVSTGSYNPIADATIGRKVFRQFLEELKSPALNEADTMFDACVKEGCDPALALAFFEHESSGGTNGVAIVTKSIGNIRCSPGYACFSTLGNGAFRLYGSWTESVKDWAILLKSYRDDNGLRTLEQIIPKYAPQSDNNNEAAYIQGVKKRVDDLRQRELNTRN